ncbi:MAG: hypothetical protein JNJ77_01650 [Planctomycetia bacterium]|nr:hypothetical protein [Planctomycetia bacterium]
MVRLQCPACKAVVKISEEMTRQHPMVRCAGCQGLVSVANHQVVEKSATLRRAKKTIRRRSAFPAAIVLGVGFGLLALTGLGIGIYFLISSGSATKQIAAMQKEDIENLSGDALVDRMCQLIEMMLGELEKINTPEDVINSRKTLDNIGTEMRRVQSRLDARARNSKDMDEAGRILITIAQRMRPLEARFKAVQERLSANPLLSQAIAQAGVSPLYSGVMSSPNQKRGNPRSNILRDEFEDYENGGRQQIFLECVQALRTLAFQAEVIRVPFQLRQFADEFEKYKDQLDSLIDRTREKNLRFIGLSFAERNEYDAECQTLVSKIQTLISGMLAREDFRQAMAESSDEYSDLKLDSLTYGQFVVTIPQVGTNLAGTRPRSRGRGAENNSPTISRPDLNLNNMSPREQLKAFKHAKFHEKLEIMRMLQSLPVSDDLRKDVLETACEMMESSDLKSHHDDLFPVFKKWAKTQEEKEMVGKYAGVFLNDFGLKKSAMRWYGENKVISASKEIARSLKERSFDNKEAADALIEMGPGAEPSVIPILNDIEPKTRHLAIEILARIGTKESLPPLRKLYNDPHVGLAAKQAARIIGTRTEAAEAKEKSK